MKNIKFNYFLVILSVGLFFTSCKKEETPTNQITITIEEPMNSETIAMANCAKAHVHVDFVASIENHEVEVILHPEGDVADKIINYNEHAHDKTITFEQEVDLCSYAAGTCFHLEVSACVDHDCVEKSRAEAEFCLN